MGEIKGIWFGVNKQFGLGFNFDFDKEIPNFFFLQIGPFYMEINR